ncbi:MAG: carbon storage regulator CsrA [Methylocystaceae bacterium]
MLVLTRKVDENIIIGDEIEVVVVAIEGDRVKLGVKAPRGVPIHRGEVYQAILDENKAAVAQTSPQDLLKAMEGFKKDK